MQSLNKCLPSTHSMLSTVLATEVTNNELKKEFLSPGNFILVQGSLLLRKMKQAYGKKSVRGCSGISVGRSRRRHLSGDLQERGAMLIFEGRASQAEEMARAKPGVKLYRMCVRNRREGIRVLGGEPLGHEVREGWGDT